MEITPEEIDRQRLVFRIIGLVAISFFIGLWGLLFSGALTK
jgi:hypothetical protein